VQGLVYILVYVDDLIVAGQSPEGVQMVKASESASSDVRDMGVVKLHWHEGHARSGCQGDHREQCGACQFPA